MTEETPGRTPGLRCADLRDGLLVHVPEDEELHLLNASARAVFDACDGRRSVDEIVDAVAPGGRSPTDAVGADVRRTVADLIDRGLLAAHGTPVRRSPATASPPPAPARPQDRDLLVRSLDRTVGLAAPPDVLADLAQLLGPLTIPRSSLDAVDGRYELTSDGDRWSTTHDGRALRGATSLRNALDHLLWHINHEAIVRCDSGLLLHAAAAAGRAGAVMLPGDPDAGKSTTVAAACAAGLAYLTDEAALLAPDSRPPTVLPYPKPLTLDRSSRLLLADEQVMGDGALPMHDAEPGGDVPPVDPARLAGGVGREPRPVVAVAFPDRSIDGPPRPLDAWEAASRLGPCSFNLVAGGAGAVRQLAELATDVPCFVLPTASLSEASTHLRRLAETP